MWLSQENEDERRTCDNKKKKGKRKKAEYLGPLLSVRA